MALSPESLLPHLPGLATLEAYLRQRDKDAPRERPQVMQRQRTALSGGMRQDRIVWMYRGTCDGFLVWWELGHTADPMASCIKTGAAARSFCLILPEDAVVTYAVSAYRWTHRGEAAGPKITADAWTGVS